MHLVVSLGNYFEYYYTFSNHASQNKTVFIPFPWHITHKNVDFVLKKEKTVLDECRVAKAYNASQKKESSSLHSTVLTGILKPQFYYNLQEKPYKIL